MPKKHNKNHKKTDIVKDELDFSELHLEYEQQLLTQKEWDEYMENSGLNTLKNFEFLPQYKPMITYEMLVYDYSKPENERWKKGEPYPLRGQVTQPKVIENSTEN
jgi:hypothetical protein